MSNSNFNSYNEDGIDLTDLFKILWHGKWLILASTIFIAVCSIIYSVNLQQYLERWQSPVECASLEMKYALCVSGVRIPLSPQLILFLKVIIF